MDMKQTITSSSFYVICPNCGKPISFQGVDIQYYKPIGYELENTLYPQQKEVVDTNKTIACPHCEGVFKASECDFILNDF